MLKNFLFDSSEIVFLFLFLVNYLNGGVRCLFMVDKFDVGYLLEKSWSTMIRNFWVLAPLVFFFYFVPLSVRSVFFIYSPLESFLGVNEVTGAIDWSGLIVFGALFLFLYFAFVVISYFSTISIAYFVLKEESLDTGELLRKSSKYFFGVIGVVILVGLFLIPLYLLLIIPGVIFSVYWVFSYLFVIDSDDRGLSALRKSYRLVKGNWWAVLGRFFLAGLIVMAVNLVFSFVSWIFLLLFVGFTAVITDSVSPNALLFFDLLDNVLLSLIYLFSSIYTVYVFKGLKERVSSDSKEKKVTSS